MDEKTATARKTVEDWMRQYVAAVVDVPAGTVSVTAPFPDLGVDSAEVVIMTGVLEEEFSIEVSAELPFAHPTIASFLDALEAEGLVAA